MTQTVKRTERGWPAHFISADRCLFRRNTLLECGKVRVIVSTVGNMRIPEGTTMWIGADRFYETMAFHAKKIGVYWDVNTKRSIHFKSPWAVGTLSGRSDQLANDQHEAVVAEISARLARGWKGTAR